MKPTKLRPNGGRKMHGPVAAGTAEERVLAEEWEKSRGGLYAKSRLEQASYLHARAAFEYSKKHAPTRAPVDIRATEYHRRAGEIVRVDTSVTCDYSVVRVTPSSFLDVWREHADRSDILLRGDSGQWCLRIDAASIIRHPDGNAAYALLQVVDVTSGKHATIAIHGATDVMIGRAAAALSVPTPPSARTRTERSCRQMTAAEFVIHHRSWFCEKTSFDVGYTAQGAYSAVVDVVHAAFGDPPLYLVSLQGAGGSAVMLRPTDYVTVRAYDVG